jgi:hypothetical protein
LRWPLAGAQRDDQIQRGHLATQFVIVDRLLEVRAVILELPKQFIEPLLFEHLEVCRPRDFRIARCDEPSGEAIGQEMIVGD